MIVEKRTVYRCEHCRRFTKFQARFAIAHEVHCRKNPNRTPFIGELTFIIQAGDFDYERREWVPFEKFPAWWPGAPGMIYAADGWHKVDGYRALTAEEDGPTAGDVWPMLAGKPLNEYKPLWRRVHAMGLPLDEKRQAFVDAEEVELSRDNGGQW